MASIGDLVVNLRANNAHFQKGMKHAQSTVKRFGSLAKSAITGGVVAGVAGAVGGIAVLQRQLESLDKTAKTAAKLGVLPERLAGLQFAFEQTGVDANAGAVAIQRMTRRISDAANGGGPAAKALKELGLNAAQLAGMAPDVALERIADSMAGVQSQSDRVRLAFALFDSEGVGLVNTLAGGAAGLRQFQAEAERLGLGFSQEELARVEAANDAMNRINRAVGAVAGSIAVKLAPSIEWIATAMQSSSEAVGGFGQVTSSVMGWLQTAWQKTTNGLATGITAAMATGEWAFNNFQAIAQYTFTEAARLAVQFTGVVGHFFTGTLPALLSWFGENWHSVFFTAFDFVATGFINVGENIRNVWSAILDFITGSSDGLNFTWTPLLDGFRNTISQLPDLPEREMGELERQLTVDSERLGSQLAASFDDTVGERLRMLAEMQQQAVAAAPEVSAVATPGVSPLDMSGVPGAGATQQKNLAGVAARGSSEAFKIIASSMQKSPQVKEQQKGNKLLQTIAKNTKPDANTEGTLAVQGPV